ncbi:UPF0175 family protein [Halorientalis brevis]|uniref:UPF0175 family protein n=1 Tax=Halorientalis brevis TaxID=1126241 RepID=A0ABD6C9A1_9EURY|nr:UPF0175 family protein [Halorientalis brevis]
MSVKSFTTALTLYRSQTLSLEQAAEYSSVSVPKMASALGARGIPVREVDRDVLAAQAAD